MSVETHDALNEAIRSHFVEMYGEGEPDEALAFITHWTLVAAGVSKNGTPRIMNEDSDEQMPMWQSRGLLHEGIHQINMIEMED